jgi:hypothetical protein
VLITAFNQLNVEENHMGGDSLTKRSSIVLAVAAALFALVAYKAEAADSFKLSQTAQDVITCAKESGTWTCGSNVSQRITFTISAKTFSGSFDMTDYFTADSDVGIVVGEMTNVFTLAQDPKFVEGKKSVKIVVTNGLELTTISLKASPKGLGITIKGIATATSTNTPSIPVTPAMMSPCGTSGTTTLICSNTTAAVSFSNTVTKVATSTSFAVDLTGTKKTKDNVKAKNGDFFDLTTVKISGSLAP